MKLTKQDKKEIKQWTKALRSGEFDQTTMTLQNNKGYCCLGVACKLFTKNPRISYTNCLYGVIPSDQPHNKKWLNEIDNEMKRITGAHLTSMNDSFGYSFTEIADVIDFVVDNELNTLTDEELYGTL